MNTRTKFILTYIGGIVTGIILTFVFALVVTRGGKTSSPSSNVVLFDNPQQEIEAHSFSVMQVLPDGSALATVEDTGDYSNYGTVVMFLVKDGKSSAYYDGQIIVVPSGKRAIQVGTYKYVTRQDIVKTVPVVDFLD